MSRLTRVLALTVLPALAACSDNSSQAVDAVSPTEVKALDEAAQMLDARRLPPDAVAPQASTSATPAPTETAT